MGSAARLKLLLDTHIWLWSLGPKQKLSKKVARQLADARNELWISPISCWEILTLAKKGRLQLNRSPQAWVAAALRAGPFREAAITNEIALALTEISLPHSDPADAFLAATARVYGLTLVTADENLAAGSGFGLLRN